MHVLIVVGVFLALIHGPGWWVAWVMERYSRPEDRYDFTGAELARRLLAQTGVGGVEVEISKDADHYDPEKKVIRLSKEIFESRSLTAITIAAHEVGHAFQDARGYQPFRLRTSLVKRTVACERIGATILMVTPLVMIFTRIPASGLLTIFGGFLMLGLSTAVHLITLPVEFDASFGRALPMLTALKHLHPGDEPHAHRILHAAALTYVAGSLRSLLSVARWWAIIRR